MLSVAFLRWDSIALEDSMQVIWVTFLFAGATTTVRAWSTSKLHSFVPGRRASSRLFAGGAGSTDPGKNPEQATAAAIEAAEETEAGDDRPSLEDVFDNPLNILKVLGSTSESMSTPRGFFSSAVNVVLIAASAATLAFLSVSDLTQRALGVFVPLEPGIVAKALLVILIAVNSAALIIKPVGTSTEKESDSGKGEQVSDLDDFLAPVSDFIDDLLSDFNIDSIGEILGGPKLNGLVDWFDANSTTTRFCDVAGMDEVRTLLLVGCDERDGSDER